MAATIEHIDFHGLPALRLRTAGGAAAVVSLHGAQALSWTPSPASSISAMPRKSGAAAA